MVGYCCDAHSAAFTCALFEMSHMVYDHGHPSSSSEKKYTVGQIKLAWQLMCRGDMEGLRKRDVERLVRTFRPNIPASELEQLVGPIKARITYSQLKSILQVDCLPKVSRGFVYRTAKQADAAWQFSTASIAS